MQLLIIGTASNDLKVHYALDAIESRFTSCLIFTLTFIEDVQLPINFCKVPKLR